MKTRSLALLAGVGGAVIASGSAQAGFVGMQAQEDLFSLDKTTLLSDIPGYNGERVFNIYAVMENPDDQVVGVVGSPSNPFSVFTSDGSGFINNVDFGDDTPPSPNFVALVPSLNWDSFFTIGLKLTGPEDELIVAPGTPGPNTDKWPGSKAQSTNMAWTVPPTIEGVPVPQSVAGNDQSGENKVLVMRLVVQGGGGLGQTDITGTFGVLVFDGPSGESAEVNGFFTTALPAPGALALLGLAGLAGVSRRRRG